MNTLTLDIPDLFDELSIPEWERISETIENTTATSITLNVCGGGGGVYILTPVLKSIQKAQKMGKVITAKIFGEAYSCHAFLSAHTDHIIFTEGSSLIFHNVGVHKSLLFGLIQYRSLQLNEEDCETQRNMLARCVAMEILTEEDLKIMRDGGEVTVYA